jgi:hypothetical protein
VQVVGQDPLVVTVRDERQVLLGDDPVSVGVVELLMEEEQRLTVVVARVPHVNRRRHGQTLGRSAGSG